MRRRTRPQSSNAVSVTTWTPEPASAVGLAALKPNGHRGGAIGHEQPRATARGRHVPAAGHPWPATGGPGARRVRGVAGLQHNVALCKPPPCHGACDTASSPRAGAGKRRASASLRITHVHVHGRPGAVAPAPCPDTPSAACAHIPVRACFGTNARGAWTHGTASARPPPRACTRAAHACKAACALTRPRPAPARTRAGRLNRCAVQAEPVS